jgi:phosphoribosylanthranilate isomerase
MIKIKVCGMNDPENVKTVSGVRPDYLGYIFYNRSPRFVGDKPDSLLFKNAGSEIIKVGVFVNEDEEKVIKLTKAAGIDTVQLHGNESNDYCSCLKSSGLTVIKALCIGNSFRFETLTPYLDVVDFLLFDTKNESYGGSGKKFNWNKLSEYPGEKPFFLSGGIGPDDSEIIKSLDIKSLYAVDINSMFEIKPGIKNAYKVESFINSLKNWEKS